MSDSNEDELASVMAGVLDQHEFPEDAPIEEVVDLRPDPVAAVALAMVLSAVDGRPDVVAAAKLRGAVIILVTPSAWTDAVAAAWRSLVLGQPDPGQDDGSYQRRNRRERIALEWPLGLDDDSAKDSRWKAKDDLVNALRSGRGVLACVEKPDVVSATLRAAADATVTINPPFPAALQAMAEVLGDGCAPLVDDEVAAGAQPDHLLACLRPGQSAASYVGRLARVVSEARPGRRIPVGPQWTLDRLHGNEEVRAFGKALALDMRAYISGNLPWSDVSPGVLLSGPPGCGKTVTAQALASECGIPFLSTSYSEWQAAGKEGHSGDVIRCLRGRFQQARVGAPCILFVDELDSVRARVGNGSVGRHDDWWTMITNALLEELDGCTGHPGVVVVAATNFPEKVDAAIRRSGRLDKEIRLTPPDAVAISGILREHLGDHLPGADLCGVAQAALGGSAADIASWVRTARQAARHAGRAMDVADLMEAISPPVANPISAAARRRLAFHEAGHAVVAAILLPGSLISVSIRAGAGGASTLGGVELASPTRGADTLADVDAILMRLLGGRAAELLACDICGGGSGGSAGSDLAQATLIAASAELAWGLGGRLLWMGDPTAETLPHMLSMNRDVAARVEGRLAGALAAATALLTSHRGSLDALAAALLERETLAGAAAEVIVRSA